MIKDGILQVKEICDTPVLIDLIPKENRWARPGLRMVPTSKTIHETDNLAHSADARMHTRYVDNTKQYVSWHFTVDDSIIIQELPINENAWHAGDGSKGKGNRTSIAIETCVNDGGDFEKAKENAIKLIKFLDKYLPQAEMNWQHNHWNGKNCPKRIRKSGWKNFLDKVEAFELEQCDTYPVPDWSLESWKWAVAIGLNDGIVQNPFEIQNVKMFHSYDKYIRSVIRDEIKKYMEQNL